MANFEKPRNLLTLKKILEIAEKNNFAVGSFSARYTFMIRSILLAAQKTKSPVIVQVSQKELKRYGTSPEVISKEFFSVIQEENIQVPVVLHLDHTQEFDIIKSAISAGFTSVMIDASAKPLEGNIEITKKVVDYAHGFGVSVEAELGKIGTTDFIETDDDTELYTDPDEASEFVLETNADALAVSVGSAHGVYQVKDPTIDYQRLTEIREKTDIPLVLHGGSGLPPTVIKKAIEILGGGISKVNIATDLEIAFLDAIKREYRMTDEEARKLSAEELKVAGEAVENLVIEKIGNFLGSEGKSIYYDVNNAVL